MLKRASAEYYRDTIDDAVDDALTNYGDGTFIISSFTIKYVDIAAMH